MSKISRHSPFLEDRGGVAIMAALETAPPESSNEVLWLSLVRLFAPWPRGFPRPRKGRGATPSETVLRLPAATLPSGATAFVTVPGYAIDVVAEILQNKIEAKAKAISGASTHLLAQNILELHGYVVQLSRMGGKFQITTTSSPQRHISEELGNALSLTDVIGYLLKWRALPIPGRPASNKVQVALYDKPTKHAAAVVGSATAHYKILTLAGLWPDYQTDATANANAVRTTTVFRQAVRKRSLLPVTSQNDYSAIEAMWNACQQKPGAFNRFQDFIATPWVREMFGLPVWIAGDPEDVLQDAAAESWVADDDDGEGPASVYRALLVSSGNLTKVQAVIMAAGRRGMLGKLAKAVSLVPAQAQTPSASGLKLLSELKQIIAQNARKAPEAVIMDAYKEATKIERGSFDNPRVQAFARLSSAGAITPAQFAILAAEAAWPDRDFIQIALRTHIVQEAIEIVKNQLGEKTGDRTAVANLTFEAVKRYQTLVQDLTLAEKISWNGFSRYFKLGRHVMSFAVPHRPAALTGLREQSDTAAPDRPSAAWRALQRGRKTLIEDLGDAPKLGFMNSAMEWSASAVFSKLGWTDFVATADACGQILSDDAPIGADAIGRHVAWAIAVAEKFPRKPDQAPADWLCSLAGHG